MQKKFKQLVKRPGLRRKREPESRLNQAIEGLPRITNETVAEHREEMLRGARKYIYPLKQTRRRVVVVSTILLVGGVVLFFAYTWLSLYKFQSTSGFVYRITQVLPFPIAKAGSNYVAYENYLFELRHYEHYYQTQQNTNFSTDSGKKQLDSFKKQALDDVVNNAYTKQLAKQNNVSVSDSEVNDAVTLLRQQNRLGTSDQEFADVLKEFWGWSPDDFHRELKQQLLAQKVVAALDRGTTDRAGEALGQLRQGKPFADVAKQYSADANTRDTGGEYPFLIERGNRDLSPRVIDALYRLQPGQTSDVIDTGYSLEIVKVLSVDNGKVRAAHIVLQRKSIDTYIAPLKRERPQQTYVTLPS